MRALVRGATHGVAVAVALVLAPARALHAAPSTVDDRIALSANGSSLTGTGGGGGASAGWLHNFDADTLLGVAAQYQALSVSHWAFASLSGAVTRGPGDQRYTLYGQADEGAGRNGPNAFKYRIEGLGVTGTYFHRFSATLEDKQVNVESTHGNLPKLQLAYLWNPRIQTTVGHQHSFGGNLGTRLTTARIDVYASQLSFLAGGAFGQAAPALLGQVVTQQGPQGNITLAPHDLREGYVGIVKSFPQLRSELTLIADYQRLSGGEGMVGNVTVLTSVSTRWTGTLNYVFHIGHHGT
ncbi:MAG: hypothetical protein ACJ8R9_15250 [Steroidobacteraceae bacterium]